MEATKNNTLIAVCVSLGVVIIVIAFSELMQSIRVETIQTQANNHFSILESQVVSNRKDIDQINDDELIKLRGELKRIEAEELQNLRIEIDALKLAVGQTD